MASLSLSLLNVCLILFVVYKWSHSKVLLGRAGIVCIGVVLSALCFRKSSLQDQSGGGGQLCFILTIDIINNHLPHITIILSILLPPTPPKKKKKKNNTPVVNIYWRVNIFKNIKPKLPMYFVDRNCLVMWH